MVLGRLFRSSKKDKYYPSYHESGYTPATPHQPAYATPAPSTPYTYQSSNYTPSPGIATPVSELPSPRSFGTPRSNTSRSPSYGYSTPAPTYTSSPSPFQNAGLCVICSKPNRIEHTAVNKWNINSGRPFRRCSDRDCDKFNGFTDDRGVQPGNPLCNCQMSSRLVATKKPDNEGLRVTFYTCSHGTCTWSETAEIRYTDAQLREMVRRGQI